MAEIWTQVDSDDVHEVKSLKRQCLYLWIAFIISMLAHVVSWLR
jgi:hypothetical protein